MRVSKEAIQFTLEVQVSLTMLRVTHFSSQFSGYLQSKSSPATDLLKQVCYMICLESQ